MDSENNINTIKILLNNSTSHLSQKTLEKLRAARSHALEHQRTHQTSPVFAWINSAGTSPNSSRLSKSTSWAIAVLFVAFLISGLGYWQSYTKDHDIDDVDIAILTDDLPIHVYLD